MRRLVPLILGAFLFLPSPASAAVSEAFSWGKPGVSIDKYRQDAVECGRAGYYLDVSNTEAAHVFKRATSQLEANETDLATLGLSGSSLMNIVANSAHIVESTRPDEQFKQVGALLNDTVTSCLKQRGYTQFRLTKGQQDRLRHLHLGSPERHAYLYRLASDPEVLTTQAP